jgi:chromate transport protein ChrA
MMSMKKAERENRLSARICLIIGIFLIFAAFPLKAPFLTILSLMLGFLFLVSAIIYERDAKMLKYEAERVNWKPRKGVNYYKGLETENED